MSITIYHNPACGTSRNTLALLRQGGLEPTVVEYLKNPLTPKELRALIDQLGGEVRAVLRSKEKIYTELNLADPNLSEAHLLAALAAHPILLNRPIVVTPKGARLCRPMEAVFAILPADFVPAATELEASCDFPPPSPTPQTK